VTIPLPVSGPDPGLAGRLLVVEDEQKVAGALREGLEGEGYTVVVDGTGEGAFARLIAQSDTFDAILLDLTLPGRDGLDVLSDLRRRGIATPVIVLTARDTLGDRVVGLDAGADDYLIKPFAFAELLARLRAVGRRGRVTDAGRLVLDTFELDRATRQVTRAGRPIELTAKEFDLLHYLARHCRQVVSRDTLAREVWRETARSTTLDNVIDVHISRLRRKIDLEGQVKLIQTVRGVGFVLREDAE
jgi:two-component system copper resistance phosphate regulon response regulator CusR